jgi:hypothetical protein
MHYEYVVILKRENARKTDLVSLLLLIFSILVFGYLQIQSGISWYRSLALAILLCGVLMNLYLLKEGREMQFRTWLLVAGILWIGMPVLEWLVFPFFLLAFLEIQAKYPLEIGFYQEGVVINSLFKKRIPWTALQSVLLKDGLLTLDFRNNKLFQKEVLDDDEPDAQEDEFNDYCRSKLVNLP